MTRRRRWLLIVGGAGAAIAVIAILVLLYVPIAQESSGYAAIGLRLYSFESESLFGQSWSNFTYHGVTFEFHLWCLITPAAGEICGNATESGGVRYSYSFMDGPPSPSPSWQTWVAPDGHEAVQYRQGGLAHLLVQV